jgi:hypothetical protein
MTLSSRTPPEQGKLDPYSHLSASDSSVTSADLNRDTFTGAYSSDYLRQKAKGTWDIKSAVIRANKAAAMTIMSVGAQDGIPWSDEIDRFDAPYKVPSKLRAASTAGFASEASI